MAAAKSVLRRGLHRVGIDIVPYDGRRFVDRRRIEVINAARATVVVDVGAGSGQFGARLRAERYRGRIVSFEPVSAAFEKLRERAAPDRNWRCLELALGDHSGDVTINVAGNLWSSSFLAMTSAHESAAPESVYVGEEAVRLARLDSLDVIGADDRAYLKIDVQGAEAAVLDGAEGVFEQINAAELELSLAELYRGQELLPALRDRMLAKGFVLVWLGESVFRDSASDDILALDGIFIRPPS